MLAGIKLNSIENKISEALANNEICHEDFTRVNEEKAIVDLKKVFELWKLKEKNSLIKEGKGKTLIKLLDKLHNYKTIISYSLKCRKNTENINLKISGTSNGKTLILSNCVICGSLSKIRKQMDYRVV